MIALKYINKNAATVAAIRDYDNMRFIMSSTPQEIKDRYAEMTSPSRPKLSDMPSERNFQAGTDKLAVQIDKLDILRDRYRQANEYMDWFGPAWSNLSDIEQKILAEFYKTDNQKSGATYRLMHELNYSESHIERLRSNALNHLRCILYGL